MHNLNPLIIDYRLIRNAVANFSFQVFHDNIYLNEIVINKSSIRRQ